MSPSLSLEPGQRPLIQLAGLQGLGRQFVGPELGLSHTRMLGLSGPPLVRAGPLRGHSGCCVSQDWSRELRPRLGQSRECLGCLEGARRGLQMEPLHLILQGLFCSLGVVSLRDLGVKRGKRYNHEVAVVYSKLYLEDTWAALHVGVGVSLTE